MLLKDFLIERVAEEMSMPKGLVETVVMHQFKGITKALQTCKSVEMTGFGKWVFLESKGHRQLAIWKDYLEKLRRGETIPVNIPEEEMEKDIELLTKRLNQEQC